MKTVLEIFKSRLQLLHENSGHLVAHNIAFDLAAVQNEFFINFSNNEKDLFDSIHKVDTIDTTFLKKLGRDVVGDFKRKKLGVLFALLCADHPR